jgi:hypothetical protein
MYDRIRWAFDDLFPTYDAVAEAAKIEAAFPSTNAEREIL